MGLEEFREYCKSKEKINLHEYSGSIEFQRHKKFLHCVSSNPQGYISGIGKIIESYNEVQLVDKDRRTLGAVDIVFFTQNRDVVLCEVKVSDVPGRGACSQLEKQYYFVRDNFCLITRRISLQKKSSGKIFQRIIEPNVRDLLRTAKC